MIDIDDVQLNESPMYYFTLGSLDAQFDIDNLEGVKRFGQFVIESGKMAKFIPESWPELFNEPSTKLAFNMLFRYGEGKDFGKDHGTIRDMLTIAAESNARIDAAAAKKKKVKAEKVQITNGIEIRPFQIRGSHRTGTLSNITKEEIIAALGFKPNISDDPYKVKNSWGFTFDGEECGIWDYKGSHKYNEWSTYGSTAKAKDAFRCVFKGCYSN